MGVDRILPGELGREVEEYQGRYEADGGTDGKGLEAIGVVPTLEGKVS